jgi:hypothetical protein
LVAAAKAVLLENGMESPGIFSLIGTRLEEGSPTAPHLARVFLFQPLCAGQGGELSPPGESRRFR